MEALLEVLVKAAIGNQALTAQELWKLTHLSKAKANEVVTEAVERQRESAVRAAAHQLRLALDSYYQSKGVKDAFRISIGNTPGSYVADFDARGTRGEGANAVLCQWLGDAGAGLRYLAKKMELDEQLWRVRDTHVRVAKDHVKYDDPTLLEFERGLRVFLDRPNRSFQILAGQAVDEKYVNAIIASGTAGIEARRLHRPGPLMNFTLLDYEVDGSEKHEVLLGWGGHGKHPHGAVFQSTDERLTAEFNRFYGALVELDQSEGVALRFLLRSPAILTNLEFLEREAQVPRRSEIWIASPTLANVEVRSGSPLGAKLLDTIRNNAKRGVRYRYLYPREGPGAGRINELEEMFSEHPGTLVKYPLDQTKFDEIMLISTYFICLKASDKDEAEVFMQLPVESTHKGWVQLDDESAKKIRAVMGQLTKKRPPRRRNTARA